MPINTPARRDSVRSGTVLPSPLETSIPFKLHPKEKRFLLISECTEDRGGFLARNLLPFYMCLRVRVCVRVAVYTYLSPREGLISRV